MFSPGSLWSVKLSGLVFKIRVYLGGPVAPICTINKTKSSSSCLQLELVLFYYLRSRNPRAVTRQHHENPPRPRPRPQHPRQTLSRRKIPRSNLQQRYRQAHSSRTPEQRLWRRTPRTRKRIHFTTRTRPQNKWTLSNPQQVKRYPHLHPRQRRRQRHPLDERHRLVLLHLQRIDTIRQTSRLSLPSCNKKLPRQAHQNWLFWQRPWLGRKLLSAQKNSMRGNTQRELLYG